MDTIIYTRQSLDSSGEGLAVARQEEACRQYAAERGWTVVALLSDNSISATTGKRRPGFEAVLTHPVRQVIVWHQDRLLRVSKDLERVLEAGLTVHAVQAGTLDLSTPTGKAVARTVAAWTTYEGEQKAARQRLANAQRAKDGKAPAGRRAFGYGADGTVREDEAQMVGWLYQEVLRGASLKGLARTLNDKGFTTPAGKPWQPYATRYVLLNPRNAGLRVHRGEIVGQGSWEPLVGEADWRAVQTLLVDPSRRTSSDTRSRYLLPHLVTCARCGGAMATARTATGSRLYKCEARGDLSVQAAPIDAYVTEVIVARLSRPDALDLLPTKADSTDLIRERAALTQRLDDLATAYAMEQVTLGQMTTATSALRGRLDEIEARLASQHTESVLAPLAGSQRVRELWEAMEVSQQRAIVKALFASIVLESPGRGVRTFNPERVRLHWRGNAPAPHAAQG